jgi:predicted nucleotidyltransferase
MYYATAEISSCNFFLKQLKKCLHYAPTWGTNAPIMSTPPKIDQLGTTLFGKTRRAILTLLFSHVGESFYLRQLTRSLGVGMGAVQRELKALVDAGIISRNAHGHQVYYQANSQSPIFKELKSLVVKTAGVGDVLRTALSPLADRIDTAFIYGSIARGEERKSSDIDVLIVGNVTFADVTSVLSSAQETIGREINPTVYPRTEFLSKVRTGHHFLSSVLDGEKLFLIGDKDELERMVEKRLARRS